MAPFIITHCEIDDISKLREIQKEAWLVAYPSKEYNITKEAIEAYFSDARKTEQWIDNVKKALTNDPTVHGFVAKIGHEIVGYAFAQKTPNKNRITAIYVLPSHQGKGIGKKLMQAILDWLENTNPVTLETAIYNTPAINFYKACGFVENKIVQNDTAAASTGISFPEIEMVKNAFKIPQ
jgi:ribosomal protein S18 acetylase RimI-like enzyme